ncbi:hypothetical protein DN069_22555 [Streptacidiphilus pinicola]|uniref:Uncharacterized protein n=1 Tax=Streptacidiphilus pinicola TaxID=2219663 RepID=A0A2X0IIH2_9ACTN|nr:hypothetical protein [Streptacidiphilus pinicola]RAG83403.1 hypothetical protein DN069_22555 [Streptacidiphilus pinicola]
MVDHILRPALLRAAARNNADWCEAMCRAHGLRGEFRADAWTSADRSPPYYPDAVTLSEHADAAQVLARIDVRGPGATVKDSYARLDLEPHGFAPLFDAEWIARDPQPAGARPVWRRVRDETGLARWEQAWDGGAAGLFLAPLLEDPSVLVLAAPEFVAGAVLSLGAGVVGVSNLFCGEQEPDRVWRDCLIAASAYCPGLPVVGYEDGADLAAAERAGFTRLGPLRVWLAAG